MKSLFILSALPGCGKSTWARRYQACHENVSIISSDGIRKEITGRMDDFSKQDEVWTTFAKRIHEYAQKYENTTVILDALCDLNWLRAKYVKENPEFDRYVLVLFPRTVEQIRFFNKERPQEAWVPEDALQGLINKWEEPSEEVLTLFDEVIKVEIENK